MIGAANGYQTAAHSGNAGRKVPFFDVTAGVMTDESKNYSAYDAGSKSEVCYVSGRPVTRCMPNA